MKLADLLFKNTGTKQILLKNTFWLGFSEILSKLLLFPITIMITRHLGASEYGKYSFALVFVNLFAVFTDLGFNNLIIREIAGDIAVAKKHIDNILVIKFLFGFVYFGVIFISIHLLGKTENVKSLVYLSAVCAFIQSYMLFFQSVYQGYQKMQYSFISRVFFTLLLFFLIFMTIDKLSAKEIVTVYIFTSVITLVFLLFLTRRLISNFFLEIDYTFWKKVFFQTWPFLAGMVCISIYVNSDSVILSIFRTYREVGLYQAAYKIFFAFQTISLFHQVIFPKLMSLYSKNNYQEYRRLIKVLIIYSLYILIPLGIFVTIFSTQILLLVYGKEFVDAHIALSFLIWTGILIHLSTFWSTNLIIRKDQKKWFYSAFVGAVVNLSLNIIFIPRFGIVAAAVTTLVSELIVFVFLFAQTTKEERNLFI